ncbi:hypothetical protein BH20ACT19_BH20ACT19_12080 [soil metagenome]
MLARRRMFSRRRAVRDGALIVTAPRKERRGTRTVSRRRALSPKAERPSAAQGRVRSSTSAIVGTTS